MKSKLITVILVDLLLIYVLTLTYHTQPVKATLTIYIRADGSVDPPTAPVASIDNITYTLEDNIYDVSVVLQRDNIVFEGENHILQGTGSGTGIMLSSRNNVTIRKVELKAFTYAIDLPAAINNKIQNNRITGSTYGIYLRNSASNNSIFDNDLTNNYDSSVRLSSSNNNTVFGNTIADNSLYGVRLESSSHNYLYENQIVRCGSNGIWLDSSSHQQISDNIITDNSGFGVRVDHSPRNNIVGNNITGNSDGIFLFDSSYNKIIGNNVTNHGNGIRLWQLASHQMIIENSITNNGYGIYLSAQPTVTNNTIRRNNIADNNHGVRLVRADYSTIIENNITSNNMGISLDDAHNNDFYHNNFLNNTDQVYCFNSVNFYWDGGYPSGGNYWSDQDHGDCADHYSGPNQDIPGSDSIVDDPYVMDEDNRDRYPLMNQWKTVKHDVAISEMSTSKTVVGANYTVSVNVTVENQGDFPESFNVTVYVDATVINQTEVTLANMSSAEIHFVWNTSDFAKGNYTLSAYAWLVDGESDLFDNTLVDGWVFVSIPGDVDGDRDVDIYDVVKITGVYLSEVGDPDYKVNSDINGDGVINIYDVVICTSHYEQSW